MRRSISALATEVSIPLLSHGFLARRARNTPDQDAVIQLAKEAAKKGGLDKEAADALLELARLAGLKKVLDHTGPEDAKHFVGGRHIHIGPVNHLPVLLP